MIFYKLFYLLFILFFVSCTSITQHQTMLVNGTVEQKREAARMLQEIGHKAAKAVDELVVAAKDKDAEVRRLAIAVMGDNCVPMSIDVNDVYVMGLNDRDIQVRRAAVAAVGAYNNFHPNVLSTLSHHLNDDDQLTSEMVQSIFERVGSMGVRYLISACKGKESSMRLAAVNTLKRLGEDAENAKEILKKMHTDDNCDDVRCAAGNVLSMIQSY